MLTILIDGIAYGMVLFILSIGLSVTMGLMNFINLAHGAFALLGGYVTALLMNRAGVGFLATLPLAFLAAALMGAVLERLAYRRLYRRSHLDQVLFSIGLVFMAVSAADYLVGSEQQLISLPGWLQGRAELLGLTVGRYRLFLIVVCLVVLGLLQLMIRRTRFGALLRASVDDQRVARGLGINVGLVFAATFALGSGLAGLGGALAVELVGMEPGFPFRFMVYFLIVVAIGGTTTLTGPFLAAMLIGVADVAGKYYAPQLGAFLIYALMVVMLTLRPQGLLARGSLK